MELHRTSLPELRRQSTPVDFIDNRLEYHAGFAIPPARYDPGLGSHIICQPQPDSSDLPGECLATKPSPISPNTQSGSEAEYTSGKDGTEDGTLLPRPLAQPAHALKFWDSIFSRAMDEFKNDHPVEPKNLTSSKYDYRIRTKLDWDAVYAQLELAKTNYCNETKGFTAKTRKVYRRLGRNIAQPMMTAAKLVPQLDVVTPVLGAVQIVLEAAKNAAKVREEIVGGLDDIDVMFSQVELFMELYEGDENINTASASLVATTFYAIECVIGFFVSSISDQGMWMAGKRGTKAVFQGKDYQLTIEESLKAIRDQSQKLIAEADNSDRYETTRAMKEVLRRTHVYRSQMDDIQRSQGRLEHKLNKMDHEVKTAIYQPKTTILVLLNDCMINRNTRMAGQTSNGSYSESWLPHCQQWYLDPEDVLSWINIPDVTSEDLEHIEERRMISVPAQERARAEQLVHVERLQRWISSPDSCQLLIHGDYDSKRAVSGLSLLCSSLFLSLVAKAPQIIRLGFFCGLHTDDKRDDFTGGRAIVASFIYQLLCQFNFDGLIPQDEIIPSLVQSWDLEELCRLFEWLVSSLPARLVVFCVIDGILYYERENFLDDTGYALVTILRISDNQHMKAAVKVLITNHINGFFVSAKIDLEQEPDAETLERENGPAVSSRGRSRLSRSAKDQELNFFHCLEEDFKVLYEHYGW